MGQFHIGDFAHFYIGANIGGAQALQADPVEAHGHLEFWMDCPNTMVREGESITVYGKYRENRPHTAFWLHVRTWAEGTADTSDFVSIHESQEAEVGSDTLAIVVQTVEDDEIEEHETFDVGITYEDQKCTITIIDDDREFWMECPTSTVREGESVTVYGKYREDRPHTAFWLHVRTWAEGTADTSDFVSIHESQEAEVGSDTLPIVVQTVEDSDVEANETFEVGITYDEQKCTITIIDDDELAITNTAVTSSPANEDTYRFGEQIKIAFTFNGEVSVSGSAHLWLRVGPEDRDNNWAIRGAYYESGSGTRTLVFQYTVRDVDRDDDGVSWYHHAFSEKIHIVSRDTSQTYRMPSQDHLPGHKVDGRVLATAAEIISSPASGDTYRASESIDIALTYSTPVEVSGHKIVGLRMGTGDWWRGASYSRGSGTGRLVFSYEVQPGDLDGDGVSIDGGYTDENGVRHGYGGDGTIKAAGTDVVAQHNYPGLSHNAAHKVDGRPYVTGVSITSTPASGRIYAASENIEITMAFDQAVDVEGDKIVGMRMGTGADWWRGVWYNRGSGTDTLVFSYQVQPGDFDDNGISMDGGFTDANGTTHGFGGSGAIVAADTDVAVNPHYPRLPHNSDHQVDGVAPTISAVSIIPKAGSDNTYGVGDLIEVYVTFDELVLIVGTPQMTLDFDGTEKTAAYSAPQAAAAIPSTSTGPASYRFANFTYTVRVGDTDADGIAIAANALALNGGSIRDTAGNNAVLSHAALAADASHMVSAPGGL